MQELDVRYKPYCNHYTPHLPIVNSIGLVRPEKAQSIERMLIRMAQMGQIQGKVFSLSKLIVDVYSVVLLKHAK